MYDDICACSELRDGCFKKAEQARDSHFSAFIILLSNMAIFIITSILLLTHIKVGWLLWTEPAYLYLCAQLIMYMYICNHCTCTCMLHLAATQC